MLQHTVLEPVGVEISGTVQVPALADGAITELTSLLAGHSVAALASELTGGPIRVVVTDAEHQAGLGRSRRP